MGEPDGIPLRLRQAARTVCAVAPLVLAAGCAVVAGALRPAQPDLTVSQLAGAWVSPEGSGTITFYADHTFAAARLNLNGLSGLACQTTTSASGTWGFESPDGDAVSSDLTEYSSGNVVFLVFAGSASAPYSACTSKWGSIQLTTWQVNGPLGLCVEMDPDSPCFGEPWVWQPTKHA
jgi:hypothetical protein